MGATYSGDPSSSDRDWVRFVVQDTDTTNADLDDREIDSLLTLKSDDKVEAAVAAQEAICRKHILTAMRAGEPSNIIKDIRDYCRGATEAIRENFGSTEDISAVLPYAPWRTISGKQVAEDDSDRVQPYFSRDQHSMSSGGGDYTSDDEL